MTGLKKICHFIFKYIKTLKQYINDQFINEALFDLRDYKRVVKRIVTTKDK
jgi:hypothetical protein